MTTEVLDEHLESLRRAIEPTPAEILTDAVKNDKLLRPKKRKFGLMPARLKELGLKANQIKKIMIMGDDFTMSDTQVAMLELDESQLGKLRDFMAKINNINNIKRDIVRSEDDLYDNEMEISRIKIHLVKLKIKSKNISKEIALHKSRFEDCYLTQEQIDQREEVKLFSIKAKQAKEDAEIERRRMKRLMNDENY